MPRLIAILALALLSTGCVRAIKQSEVDMAMRDVGFTAEDARCVGSRAGRQLSAREMISLQRAASRLKQPIREARVGELIDAFTQNVDPATLGTVARIGAECAQQRQARLPAQ